MTVSIEFFLIRTNYEFPSI